MPVSNSRLRRSRLSTALLVAALMPAAGTALAQEAESAKQLDTVTVTAR